MTLAAEAYSVWVLDGNGPGTAYWAHVAAWASPLLGWPAFTALIFVFLLSPDGHLPSPRWRWAAWVTVTGLCLHTLGTLTLHPGDFVVGQRSGDRSVSEPLLAVGVALVAAGLVASAVSIAWRLRDRGGRPASPAAVDRVVGGLPRLRRGRDPRGPDGARRGGHLVGCTAAEAGAARGAAVRRGRGPAAPPRPDRPDRQPRPGAGTGHRPRRRRLRRRRRGRRRGGRAGDHRLLALAARDRPRRPRLPADPAGCGQGRRPALLRRRGRAVRGARRLQPPRRRQPRPVRPAPGGGGGGRAGGRRRPRGRAPARRVGARPEGRLAAGATTAAR